MNSDEQARAPGRGEFLIRIAESDDLPAIAAFEAEIARTAFPEDPIVDEEFYKAKMERFLGVDGAFVAESADDGEVVGWAWVKVRENFATKEEVADFRSFYVAPGARGGPVAFALMSAVLDFAAARRLAKIVGRTRYDNQAMGALYQRYGFRPVHVVYERDVEPARKPREAAGKSRRRRRHFGPRRRPAER